MQACLSQPIAQLRQIGIGVLVKDSAGYTRQALEAHEAVNLKWITRVPATLAEAKTLWETSDPHRTQPLLEDYRYLEVRCDYAGAGQRWLIIHSEAAEGRAHKSTQRRLRKLTEQEGKAFERLCRQPFACEQDAYHARVFQKTLKALYSVSWCQDALL